MDAKSLVSFGFFPKELPPPFTTTNLGEYFTDNKQTAAQLRKQLVTQPAIHNLARLSGIGTNSCFYRITGLDRINAVFFGRVPRSYSLRASVCCSPLRPKKMRAT